VKDDKIIFHAEAAPAKRKSKQKVEV
jgi:hypothetical protein